MSFGDFPLWERAFSDRMKDIVGHGYWNLHGELWLDRLKEDRHRALAIMAVSEYVLSTLELSCGHDLADWLWEHTVS